MTALRSGFALVIGLVLAGCVSSGEQASRQSNAPMLVGNEAALVEAGGPRVLRAQYDVEDIVIHVPRSLQVSEANSYLPKADIVWRGEPLGDRYAQVEAILKEAMSRGTAMMTRGAKVRVEITLTAFHCLTEKTRYTIGGNHRMRFDLRVIDLASGRVIDGPRGVIADVRAAGGQEALAEDAMGRTQKVVVTERLAEVIRRELSAAVPQPVPDVVSRAGLQPLLPVPSAQMN